MPALLQKASVLSGVITIVIAVITLAGWLFRIPILTSIIANGVAMNPLTAILFILSGLSLILLCECLNNGETSAKPFIGQTSGFLVLILSAIKILSFFGLDFHIDQIFFYDQLYLYNPPNSMAPNTAVCFLFLGLILFLLHLKSREIYRFAQILIFVPGTIAALGLAGDILGVEHLYDVAPYMPMALNTALAFLIVCTGVLFARPEIKLLPMRLVPKIIFSIAIVTGITLVVISFSIYGNTLESLQKAVSANLLADAHQTLARIDRVMYDRFNAIRSLGLEIEIENALETGESLPQIPRKLELFAQLNGPWDFLAIVNLKGQILSSTFGSKTGLPVSVDKLSQIAFDAAKSGNTYYSDFVFDPLIGKNTVLFSSPIIDERSADRPIVGVALGMMSWKTVEEIMAETRISNLHLYNRKGILIADSKIEPEEQILVTDNSSHPAIKKALAGQTGSEITTPLGKIISQSDREVISYTHEVGLPGFAGNGWLLVSHIPTDLIFSPSVLVAQRGIIIIGFFMIVSLVIKALFIIRFMQPIDGLMTFASKISSGDFGTRALVKSQDELGILTVHLNSMADKLQTSYANMQREIQTRTQELSLKVKELDEEKIKDEVVLNGIGDAVVAIGVNRNIIFINPAARKMLHLSGGDYSGKSYKELWKVIDKNNNPIPDNLRPIEMVFAKKQKAESSDYSLLLHDGTIIPVSFTILPIINEFLIGVVGAFRDISYEREVDRSKTEFISLASHQLRTPLSAMKWFLEMLLSGDAGKLTDEQSKFLQNVNAANERMINLVNALLNISRIQSGRLIIEPRPMDLGDLIRRVLDENEAKIKAKNQTVVFNAPYLPKINSDPKLILEVFSNLIRNANRYTPEGGRIEIFISSKESEVVTQISDTGYGIPVSEKDRIFKRFYRGTNVMKTESEGTGLGLYLVKTILDVVKGRIWFESTQGKGTTFWVSLPIAGVERQAGGGS